MMYKEMKLATDKLNELKEKLKNGLPDFIEFCQTCERFVDDMEGVSVRLSDGSIINYYPRKKIELNAFAKFGYKDAVRWISYHFDCLRHTDIYFYGEEMQWEEKTIDDHSATVSLSTSSGIQVEVTFSLDKGEVGSK